MLVRIRDARGGEVALLPEVERESGRWFRDVGMGHVADDPPMPVPMLNGYRDSGGLWVAVEAVGPVAFLAAEDLDGAVHVAQLSVHPVWARRRIGAALLAHAARRAAGRGVGALTLTTFRDVAWNAPYYARLGFRAIETGELTPGLVARLAAEAELLPGDARVAMRRDL
ncbi:GNAT family N-acetyltransferase [Saccharopolyspora sp. NFXS83]|uniref:GNAT family N-acetyltransferase n=1 Tax=Saccharopolyspora sp. NFXS83 TaxID=2993560 RepID=UPI00224AFCD8|nr:GNAT family N-acetyltransferase [Saccharopolyspora sp. NFXS83]MCX2732683.1 GNAT family N-acetyltransferase [Saccharopolyspora sp. NFXS83]